MNGIITQLLTSSLQEQRIWFESTNVPIHSSAREKSTLLLCDSLETCSFYVLMGRNQVVVRIFQILQKSFHTWPISPASLEKTLWKRKYILQGVCYDQLTNYQHKHSVSLLQVFVPSGSPAQRRLLPLLLQQLVSKAISCFRTPLF